MFLTTGGRGDAARWVRGPGDPPSGLAGQLSAARESFGVTTNPGWRRAGLAGRRDLAVDLPGTCRPLSDKGCEAFLDMLFLYIKI